MKDESERSEWLVVSGEWLRPAGHHSPLTTHHSPLTTHHSPCSSFILIFGASTRAAAFSALCAGLRPCCVDLFADTDLQARCVVTRIPASDYPRGLLQTARRQAPGPWIYTGALENHPALVDDIASERPLWGNAGTVLKKVRSPVVLEGALRAADVPCPAVRLPGQHVPGDRRWLIKPRAGAGGTGIGFWKGTATFTDSRGRTYLQEHIDGESCAAIYIGDGQRSLLLGLTRQLISESQLHAAPFHYCGSIGPLPIELPLRQALAKLGDVLVDSFGLRGIFGVDCSVRDDVPWPVEVNPRYTASVEVLEYAGNISTLAIHRHVFDCVAVAGLATLRRSVYDERFCEASLNPGLHDRPPPSSGHPPPFVGKAILFARASFLFPQDGPWQVVLRRHVAVDEMPAFADIPHTGERIEAGRPILTLFARADSETACRDQLQQIAADLDRWLLGT